VTAEVRLARCRAAGGNSCQIQLFWDASHAPAPAASADAQRPERTRARTGVLTE
jgi:hypothetical protein